MATLIVRTAEGVELRRELAGAGSRLAAGLLDLVIFGLGDLALVLGLVVVATFDPTGLAKFTTALCVGGSLLFAVLYTFLFHAFQRGATPGKRLLGIRVASADGHPATTAQLTLRALIVPIDGLLCVPLPIGLLVILGTPKRQRIGDLAAGTVVLRETRPIELREPLAGQRWSAIAQKQLPLVAAHAARISAADLSFLRAIATRTGVDPVKWRELVDRAARHYSRVLDLGPIADPRAALEELYLFARESRGSAA